MGRKSATLVNVVCGVSCAGVCVAVAAMVVVLSVFNGLGGLVERLFGSFDADVRVEARVGQSFAADSAFEARVLGVPGVCACVRVVSGQVLVRSGERQSPALLMGVGPGFRRVTSVDSIVVEGRLQDDRLSCGALLADRLGASPGVTTPRLEVYAPRSDRRVNISNPSRSFRSAVGQLSAVFLVQQDDYDAELLVSSEAFARELFGLEWPRSTSLLCSVREGWSASGVAGALREELGDNLVVRDRREQHAAFHRMMAIEKLMGFSLLLFITAIAACNVIGALTMLIHEKRETLGVLRALGTSLGFRRRVFWLEGMLISGVGAVVGALLGLALVWAQQRWGFVGFGGGEGDYIIAAYPVRAEALDVAAILLAVLTVGALVSWVPVRAVLRGERG